MADYVIMLGSHYLVAESRCWGPTFSQDLNQARRFNSRSEAYEYRRNNLQNFNCKIVGLGLSERLLQDLRRRLDFLPTCQDYAELLSYAHEKTGMNYSCLRTAMGLASYAQWAKFLDVA